MCQVPCPMGISTAVVTDAIRAKKATPAESDILHYGAEHFGAVETDLRAMLKVAVGTERVISPYPLLWATDFYTGYRIRCLIGRLIFRCPENYITGKKRIPILFISRLVSPVFSVLRVCIKTI